MRLLNLRKEVYKQVPDKAVLCSNTVDFLGRDTNENELPPIKPVLLQ